MLPKEITVFSVGDSRQLKTWSNVPYLFAKTLEEKGTKVNRVNIEENATLKKLYKYTVFALLKLVYRNSNHDFFRSGLNYYLTNRKILNALKLYPEAEIRLFLTFSFIAPEQSSKKNVLFGDWTYLYYLHTFRGRKPYWFEKKALQREAAHIKQADQVFNLFPKSHQFNLSHFENRRQHYLGNVINSNYRIDRDKLIENKKKSNQLLFIGNKKYLDGARKLIAAFEQVAKTRPERIELHFIGLYQSDLQTTAPSLHFHGYLDKGIERQNALYYKLLSQAKVVINTSNNWGAFSASTEAMYYFTPVITSPYEEFTSTYGNTLNCGYYVKDDSPAELALKVDQLLDLPEPELIEFMQNAHNNVKDFTWTSYCDKFLKIVSNGL